MIQTIPDQPKTPWLQLNGERGFVRWVSMLKASGCNQKCLGGRINSGFGIQASAFYQDKTCRSRGANAPNRNNCTQSVLFC